jgi:hypothetical protein
MAGETLQWKLKLREEVFGPASKAKQGLRAYQAEMNRVQRVQARQQAAMARANANAARRDQQLLRLRERAAAQSARNVARINAAAFRRDEAMRRAQERAQAASMRRLTRTNARASRASSSGAWRGLGMLGGVGGLGVAFGVGLLSSLASVAEGFAEVAAAAARSVVEVAAFRESSLASLTAVLGNSRSAGRAYSNAITIANQTPLDTRDVIQAQTQLAVNGFRESELTPLLAAFSDVQAARGGEAGQALIRVLGQIRGLGRVNRGDITMQAQTAGLAPGMVFQAIADRMGMTGPNARAQAEAAVGRRQVGSEVAIQAFLDATSRAYDGGGPLGTFARGQSNTLTGALSNLRNAGFNMLAGIDFNAIPGVQAFKNAILAITNALDAGSPAGQQLKLTIIGAVNAVGNLFARINPQTIAQGFGFVQRVITGVGNGLRAVWPIVRAFGQGFGPAFMAALAPLGQLFTRLTAGGGPSAQTMQTMALAARGLGQSIGFVVGSMVTLAGYAAAFIAAVTGIAATIEGLAVSLSTRLYGAFGGVGGNIVRGMIDGIRTAAVNVVAPVTGFAMSAVSTAKAALGIRSPSKVFADEVGAMIPAGVAMGITANTSGVNDAMTSALTPPSVPRLGGLGGITIYVNVTEARDARATAEAVTSDLESQLSAIFGRLAEAGA